jgi:hypothetical protein
LLDALQEVDSKNLSHYDAHCPRCRRATQIPRQRLEMAMPNWREELKQFEKEMKEHPQQEAPLPTAEGTPVEVAAPKPEPTSEKKRTTKAKAAAAESKPKAASSKAAPSADTKKTSTRKTTTKGTSKKTK